MVLAIHIDYEEIPEAAAIQKSCKICGFFSKCSSINHLLDVMCCKIPAVSDYTLFFITEHDKITESGKETVICAHCLF